MPLPWQTRKLTIDEAQEENERLKMQAQNEELQLSIAQKQSLRARLAQEGFTVNKTFGGSLKAAWTWFRSH